MDRKGIVLAGGSGTRLYPITMATSKQLLPIYDKPMIYYSISTLMQAQIRDILLISTPKDIKNYEYLLGDGKQWGINISYCIQKKPEGLAQAFILGKNFIGNSNSALVLGDNVFYGLEFQKLLNKANARVEGATVFAYYVNDPERYGVVQFDDNKRAISIEEKPKQPKSNYAVTGLYFYDNNVCDIACSVKPSARGELEITSINEEYLKQNALNVELMTSGFAWLDTGTNDSLLKACNFVSNVENRLKIAIGSPDLIAYQNSWISADSFYEIKNKYKKTSYGKVLKNYF